MIAQTLPKKSSKSREEKILQFIDYVYSTYHKKEYTIHDPIHWIYNYNKVEDQEIVGLVSSLLAFGNAKAFNKKIEKILRLWDSPFEEILNNTEKDFYRYLKNFKHRFVSGEVIAQLLLAVQRFIKEYGSIGKGVKQHWKSCATRDIHHLLIKFTEDLKIKAGANLTFLVPDPNKKGSCKRLLLYLRWMVRRDEIDLGCWDFISPSDLIIPLDTHIHQWAMKLGFTSSKVANYNTSKEITKRFSEISPNDPLKYDFSLCVSGMLGKRESILKMFRLERT